MTSPLSRLRRRWATAARFAGTAHRWTDRAALFLAGVARERPFGGTGGYAQLGRMLATEVTPRIAPANGHRLVLDLRDFTDLMVFEEIFLDGIYPLAEVKFAPDVVVDCGACAGFFTVLAHARHPAAQFHIFEPNPANLARLARNLALNAIDAAVHAAAVGPAAGEALFSGEGFGGHLSAPAEPGAFPVRVVDLPAFLRELRPQRLLLKLDIEGAERELLPLLAASLPAVTALFLETHHPEPQCRAYLQPLRAAGFHFREIRRRRDDIVPTDYIEWILTRPG